MKVSVRGQEIQESPIRKLIPFANAAKKKGTHVYHLNIGQPDIPTPAKMLDVYKNYTDEVLAYGPSQGLPSYRKKLVEYYQRHDIKLDIDDIIVTTAGSEALVFALMTACNPGDEVIVPEPFYTNYNGFAKLAGVELVPLTTYAKDGFAIPSKEKFEEKITKKTKAIMVCNPGNPTGYVYSREDVEMVAELAKENNLYVISDEVYREFVYDGETHTSILSIDNFEDHAIMVDSISKRYSACGARIGCIVSRNKTFMKAVLKFAQARLCPPTVDQLVAEAAIDIEDAYFTEIIGEYNKRRNIVFEELQKIDDIVCVKPKGAFYIIAQLPIEDGDDFAKWLLNDFSRENKTVMIAPAAGFYASENIGKNEIRIAYILNENDLKTAMNLLREGLKEYKAL